MRSRLSHCLLCVLFILYFFFFNDTATTEIYTLSLHDALPIYRSSHCAASTRSSDISRRLSSRISERRPTRRWPTRPRDRKSTRLNSSHSQISYAVFCLKKKKDKEIKITQHCHRCTSRFGTGFI